jgi:folate-binding protein YgfZ
MAITIGEEHGFRGPDFHFSHAVVPSYFSILPLGSITILDCKKLKGDEFEALRIAGLVPLSENEINQNFNPLQLGLEKTIHWAKGCYIGQEVISRLESKERAGQTLVAGKVEPHLLSALKPGEAVHTDEGPVGILTSVAPANIAGEANVLVVLKRQGVVTHAQTVLSKVRIDIIKQRD